jgi:hypothetical protein
MLPLFLIRHTFVITVIATCISTAKAREIRAMYIQAPDQSIENAFLFDGKDYREISLPQRNLSPEIDLPNGDLTLAILPKPLSSGTEIPSGAQKIQIPSAWSRCILLFFPDASNRIFPVRAMVINASQNEFPMGNTFFFNATNTTVFGLFEKQKVKLLPGKSAVIPPPISDFGSYAVDISCLFPGEKQQTSICRSTWQHDPQSRQFLFVTPAEGYKIPRIWSILDRITDSKPPKK